MNRKAFIWTRLWGWNLCNKYPDRASRAIPTILQSAGEPQSTACRRRRQRASYLKCFELFDGRIERFWATIVWEIVWTRRSNSAFCLAMWFVREEVTHPDTSFQIFQISRKTSVVVAWTCANLAWHDASSWTVQTRHILHSAYAEEHHLCVSNNMFDPLDFFNFCAGSEFVPWVGLPGLR